MDRVDPVAAYELERGGLQAHRNHTKTKHVVDQSAVVEVERAARGQGNGGGIRKGAAVDQRGGAAAQTRRAIEAVGIGEDGGVVAGFDQVDIAIDRAAEARAVRSGGGAASDGEECPGTRVGDGAARAREVAGAAEDVDSLVVTVEVEGASIHLEAVGPANRVDEEGVRSAVQDQRAVVDCSRAGVKLRAIEGERARSALGHASAAGDPGGEIEIAIRMNEARRTTEGDETAGNARIADLSEDTAAGDGEGGVLRQRSKRSGPAELIQGKAVDRGVGDKAAAMGVAHANVRGGTRVKEGGVFSGGEGAEAGTAHRVRTGGTDVGGKGGSSTGERGIHEDVGTDGHRGRADSTSAADLHGSRAGGSHSGDTRTGGGSEIRPAQKESGTADHRTHHTDVQRGVLCGSRREIDGAGTRGHRDQASLRRQR